MSTGRCGGCQAARNTPVRAWESGLAWLATNLINVPHLEPAAIRHQRTLTEIIGLRRAPRMFILQRCEGRNALPQGG